MSRTESITPSLQLQLKLMKSSFKVPLELVKKNHKDISKAVERQNQTLLLNIDKLVESNPEKKAESFAKILKNYEQFCANLDELVRRHNDYVERLQARVDKLAELERILARNPQMDSEGIAKELSNWYKEQIDLAICSYLIRTGHIEIGYNLLQEKGLGKLVDHDVIREGLEIYKEIKENKNLNVLISWCDANKKSLAKLNNNGNLEFVTYFQKFIELLKEDRIFEGIELSKKYLTPKIGKEEELKFGFSRPGLKERIMVDTVEPESQADLAANTNPIQGDTDRDKEYLSQMIDASRLLLYRPSRGTDENKSLLSNIMGMFQNRKVTSLDYYDPLCNEYDQVREKFLSKCFDLYSVQKWAKLADYFLYNFNVLHGINQNIEFLVLLSSGMSALKTKTCNEDLFEKKKVESGDINFEEFLMKNETDDSLLEKTLNHCPICSLELKHLSTSLPYSHQVVSNIFANPVMLPNGHIYQLSKLLKLNENLNVANDKNRTSAKTHAKKKRARRNSKSGIKLHNAIGNKRSFKQIYYVNDLDLILETRSVRRNTNSSGSNLISTDAYYADSGNDDDDDDEEEEDSEDEEEDSQDSDDVAEETAPYRDSSNVLLEANDEDDEPEDSSMRDISASRTSSISSRSQLTAPSDSGSDVEIGALDGLFERDNYSEELVFEDLKYLANFKFKDPVSNEVFNSSDLAKVFPT